MVHKRNFISAFCGLAIMSIMLPLTLSTTLAAPIKEPTVTKAMVGSQSTDGSGALPITVTVGDVEGDLVSLGIKCGDSTYQTVTINETSEGVISKDIGSAYQIEQIDTSSGDIAVTFTVATQSVANNVDTKNFQCQMFATDGFNETSTPLEATGIAVDNLAPDPNDDAILQLVNDVDGNGIANIGDTFQLLKGTENTDDDVIWYLMGDVITGDEQLLSETESQPIIPGDFDFPKNTPINITVIDDMGNESSGQTVSSPVVDNEAPTFKNLGTLSITNDLNSNGIAEVGDGVTLTGVSVTSDDEDTITVDLTDLTGDSKASIDVEYTVIEGDSDGDFNYTITATDNAGNTASKSSNSITVNNTVAEAAPVIEFKTTKSTIAESDGDVEFAINLNKTSDSDVTVDYTVTGTATRNSDFTLDDGTFTIVAGETSLTKVLSLIDDTEVETDETIIITISNPTNADLGSNKSHTFTVTSEDKTPTIGFNVDSQTVTEDTATASIQVDASTTLNSDVTVDYAVSKATATVDSDFTLDSGTLTLLAGKSVGFITVSIIDDAEVELTESLTITLSNPSGADLNANKDHIISITDNDVIIKPKPDPEVDPEDPIDEPEDIDPEEEEEEKPEIKQDCRTIIKDGKKVEVCSEQSSGSSTGSSSRSNSTDTNREEIATIKIQPQSNNQTEKEVTIVKVEPKHIIEKIQEREAPNPETKKFNQVENHWAEKEMSALIELKVISADTTPDKKLNRADVIKAALETAGIEVDGDANEDQAFTAAAKELNIVSEDRKDDPATRAEALKIILKALGIEITPPSQNHFQDTTNTEWYYELVNFAFEQKIIVGYEDGTFKPNQEITAAEIAKIITRAAEKLQQ